MATYAIGDVQGCFLQLKRLLEHIQFDAQHDVLWFTGDLVNRGPDSLGVLRFVRSLGEQHLCVLGNHDLHLLAVAKTGASLHSEDTLQAILAAHDADQLIAWLLARPLLHYDVSLNAVLTHAGLAPIWSLPEAMTLAREVENILHSDQAPAFLAHLYGDQPDIWKDTLTGHARWRCIVNYFTRMRLCDADGRLDFSYKGTLADLPANLYPWFSAPVKQETTVDVIFGHWAALNGEVNCPHVYALDTGCVYGNTLTALCLETKQRYQVAY